MLLLSNPEQPLQVSRQHLRSPKYADHIGSNTSTPGVRQDAVAPDWSVAEAQEFIPQGFDPTHMVSFFVLAVLVALSS